MKKMIRMGMMVAAMFFAVTTVAKAQDAQQQGRRGGGGGGAGRITAVLKDSMQGLRRDPRQGRFDPEGVRRADGAR